MTVSEDLREKARRFGEKKGFSCSKYLADEFGIECGEVSCGECYACLFERIADRIEAEPDELRGLRDENERLRGMVRERALPDGVEWPRFEDGGLVGFGDEVEHEGETWKVTGVGFESPGFDIGLRCGFDIGAMSGDYGERAKRPKPKVLDADGAPINVGDTVYLRSNGRKGEVRGFYEEDGATWAAVSYELGGDRMTVNTEGKALTHERPDSWERIEEDAYSLVMSEYLETPEDDVRDLVRRAKALAKAGE